MKLLGMWLPLCLVLLTLGATKPAQAGADNPKPAADQPELPGPEHRLLDRLTGTWDVAVRYRLGPGAEKEGTAVCETQWILGGHYLQQRYTSSLGGQPFTVLQFVGYDGAKKRFFEIKMDNMDTAVLHTEGTLSADSKVITNQGDRTDQETGKTGRLKTVLTFVDADHYTLEWFQPGPNGQDERMVLLSHTRKRTK